MCAVIELYRIGLFHGDIKVENVVVAARTKAGGLAKGYDTPDFHHCVAKLIDFGGAQICDKVSSTPF